MRKSSQIRPVAEEYRGWWILEYLQNALNSIIVELSAGKPEGLGSGTGSLLEKSEEDSSIVAEKLCVKKARCVMVIVLGSHDCLKSCFLEYISPSS